jgi:hypothetical protein
MRHRILGRAAAAGVALSLVVAAAAFADTVRGDSDTVTAGIQGSHDLGTVAPGAVIDAPVAFELRCANLQHLDVGQSVVVAVGDSTVPQGGAVAMVPVTLGPVPSTWPKDGDACAGTETPITGLGTVTVTAPQAPGSHQYSLLFSRTPTPAGSIDSVAFSGSTAAGFTLTVVVPVNTPPVLVLPGPMTVEADALAGWRAAYTVSATDAEDDPDPVPTCSPAVGTVIPLGTTTVACSVADSGGLVTTGSFDVTVNAAAAPPAPEPEPVPKIALTAIFGPPVQADGLDGRAGRTIPMKVNLMAGDDPVGEGSLVLEVTPCAGSEAVAEVAMDWRAGSERWLGLLRTRGLDAGCYAVGAVHDGVDVGSFELRLFDRRADVAKEKVAAAKEKVAAAKERLRGAPAGVRDSGKGTGRTVGH